MLDGKPSEEKLIKEAIQGESSAFGFLYDKYHERIYRFIYLKVSHREEAEDLAHQVFLKAWQNIDSYEHKGFPFSSWLYQIARNQVIDHYRGKKDIINIEYIEEIEFFYNDSDETLKLDDKDNIEAIKKAVLKLPEDQQDIVIMRFVEDIQPKEIALIIDKPESTVRVLQHRAIKNLKKMLKSNS